MGPPGVSKLGRVQCRSTEVIRAWSKEEPGQLGLFSLARRRRMGRKHLTEGIYREDRAALCLEVNREKSEGQWAQTATRKTPPGLKEDNSSAAAHSTLGWLMP